MITEKDTMTKGQMEALVAKRISSWEKEFLGRGPAEVRAVCVEDMIIIRLKEVLTLKEQHLSKTERGKMLVKAAREELVQNYHEDVTSFIEELTGKNIGAFHTSLSTNANERIIIFVLED